MFPARMNLIGIRVALSIGVSVAFALMITIPFGCGSSSRAEQKSFSSGEQAVSEFMEALRRDDKNALRTILVAEADELLRSGDDVIDRYRRQQLVKAYDDRHTIEQAGETLVLVVGENEWPFPIPLVKQGRQWVFDTAEGKEEILDRRIGRNELNTIQVMHAVVDAQREYARQDQDGDGVLEYAQTFRSDPEKKNGLYWPTGQNEEPSPLGSLVAKAKQQDYFENGLPETPQPYYGYFYKMLSAQGPNAPGGKYDYVVRGQMMGGFAVIAYPAQYGQSGIMTFIVNHDGLVYQKDIGEDTQELAADIEVFDPDQTWTPVPEQETVVLQPASTGR